MTSAISKLRIRHDTTYLYDRPVRFAPHRLMLRPREGPELRLLDSTLVIDPSATATWAQDVFGNTVCSADITAPADRLTITSTADVELSAHAWPVFDIAAAAASYPFLYEREEWTDLGALLIQQYLDEGARLSHWARGFVRARPTDTLALLKDLNAGVSAEIEYRLRETDERQSPCRTLELRTGSCRDMALLFIEAARSLGFAARIVSGYLHNPGTEIRGSSGSGSTHAWAEIYLPGAGWVAFDPTNRSVGGSNLVPVAVGRDIGQVAPVSGGFVGPADAFLGLSVEVSVEPFEQPAQAAR